jgi:hypothetical protein
VPSVVFFHPKMAFGSVKSGRLLVTSLAVLCLACQASTLIHLMVVAHVPCVEHGELIDVRPDAPPAVVQPPAAAAAHFALCAPGPVVPPHSHDHCAVLATRRESALLSQPAQWVLDGAGQASTCRPAEVRSTPALRPLDVAPKSSPPV